MLINIAVELLGLVRPTIKTLQLAVGFVCAIKHLCWVQMLTHAILFCVSLITLGCQLLYVNRG